MEDFFKENNEQEILSLIASIVNANDSYRNGTPVISDPEYDNKLEDLRDSGYMSTEEFDAFRRTLTECKGPVYSDEYVIGSLDKLKEGQTKDLQKFITKNNITRLFVSEKIDGCSAVRKLTDCVVYALSNRGDETSGEDWTNKANLVGVSKISDPAPLFVREELTLTDNKHIELGYKSSRVGTVGMMGKDDIHPHIDYIKAFTFQILNTDMNILDQFTKLQEMGFNTPRYIFVTVPSNMEDLNTILKETYKLWKESAPYDLDGLVLSSVDWTNENDQFYPEGKISWKQNAEGIETVIESITWEVSKAGKVIPVCNVKPVVINGSTITNPTGIHAQNICDKGLGIGAIVKVRKAGEIIPEIVEVVKPCKDVAIPLFCPCCSTALVWQSVNIVCTNPDCKDATVKQVEHFVKASGIENVSESSLRNWGIFSFDDLLKWTPDTNYKSQTQFYDELESKVFSQSPVKIMRCFPINGIGTTNYDKLIKFFYNLETLNELFISDHIETFSLPIGFGVKSISNAVDDWSKFYKVLQQITEDRRFYVQTEQPQTNEKENISMKLSGMSFLMTGKLSVPRSQKELIVTDNGGTIASGVSKTLSYLICSSEESASSKYVKATKLGIPIISEEEFDRMVA